LRNPQDIVFTYGSRIRLTDDLWLQVADNDPFRLLLERLVVPSAQVALPEGFAAFEAEPAAPDQPPLYENPTPLDFGSGNALLQNLLEYLNK